MVILVGFVALLAASYMMINYLNSQSRELDQLIALEQRAEALRKSYVYSSLDREKSVRQRNRALLKLARRRQAMAADRHLNQHSLNRMLAARRKGL